MKKIKSDRGRINVPGRDKVDEDDDERWGRLWDSNGATPDTKSDDVCAFEPQELSAFPTQGRRAQENR